MNVPFPSVTYHTELNRTTVLGGKIRIHSCHSQHEKHGGMRYRTQVPLLSNFNKLTWKRGYLSHVVKHINSGTNFVGAFHCTSGINVLEKFRLQKIWFLIPWIKATCSIDGQESGHRLKTRMSCTLALAMGGSRGTALQTPFAHVLLLGNNYDKKLFF